MIRKKKSLKLFVVVFVPTHLEAKESYLMSTKAYKTVEEARDYILAREDKPIALKDGKSKAYYSNDYFYGINEVTYED